MRLILTGSRPLRFFSFTVFYVAQGLPFGLVTVALPAYLAEQGVSAGAIGSFIGFASLPWSFKLFAGPVMDRFSYLAMGRRRPWVILAQLCLVLTGVAFAFFPQALQNIAVLTALCFLLNCFAATQDVAVDGMAIDVLQPEEHGRANAFMAFGQVSGNHRLVHGRRLRRAPLRHARHRADADAGLRPDTFLVRRRARTRRAKSCCHGPRGTRLSGPSSCARRPG